MKTHDSRNARRLRRASALVLSAIVLVFCAAFLNSHYERKQAQKLLQMLSLVQVGSTTQEQAREITKSFSRYQVHSGEADQFQFENVGLATLHLAPRKFVSITLEFKDRIVVSKSAQYYEEPRCGAVVDEVAKGGTFWPEHPEQGGRSVSVVGSFPSPVGWIKVRNTADVPASQRELDWKIDLTCMTSIGGCRDPRKILRGLRQADLESGKR